MSNLDSVIDFVTKKRGVTMETIKGVGRNPILSRARGELAFIMQKALALSLPEMGRILNRHHSSVLTSIGKASSRAETHILYKEFLQALMKNSCSANKADGTIHKPRPKARTIEGRTKTKNYTPAEATMLENLLLGKTPISTVSMAALSKAEGNRQGVPQMVVDGKQYGGSDSPLQARARAIRARILEILDEVPGSDINHMFPILAKEFPDLTKPKISAGISFLCKAGEVIPASERGKRGRKYMLPHQIVDA